MTFSVRNRGLLYTFVLSAAVLFFFFGKSIEKINHTFFNQEGDGIQAYYAALFHIHHDTSYWRMNGMNYPNGEQVFFTGCQPLVSNTVKAISKVVDIKPYSIGIMNSLMLLSSIFCAVFLFLIFHRLHIPLWMAVSAAVFISFASPQINRLHGHFSLTYQFAIPAFIYLFMCFQDHKTMKNSLWISILAISMAATHFYFFGFFLLISTLWWLLFILQKQKDISGFFTKLLFFAKHFTLQMVLPFIALQLLIKSIDTVADRTSSPWGFFNYVALPETVFYPFGLWYDTPTLRSFFNPSLEFEWEGVSYVGIIGVFAALGSVFLLVRSFIKWKEKRFFFPFSHPILNVLFYSSLIGFVVALALPFTVFDNYIYNHIGYFKQLRGIGRFAWVTYYGLGIIGVYLLNEIKKKKSVFLMALPVLMLSVNASEAYRMSSIVAESINNQPEYLTAKSDHPNFSWTRQVKPENYQAIIPLPYYHIGSENVWISPEGNIYEYSFMGSLFSGIPLTSVLLNRNSLSDTYDHLKIIQEASGDSAIFAQKLSTKPYLILFDKKAQLNPYETELLDDSELIFENENLIVSEISSFYFHEKRNRLHRDIEKLRASDFHRTANGFYTDSVASYIYLFPADSGVQSEVLKKRYIRFFAGILPVDDDSLEMTFSAQIQNFSTDLIPRTIFQLNFGEDGKQAELYYSFNKNLVSTRGDNGLVEFSFMYPKNMFIQVHAVNYEVTDKKPLMFNSVLIKPKKDTLWDDYKEVRGLNNRQFKIPNR